MLLTACSQQTQPSVSTAVDTSAAETSAAETTAAEDTSSQTDDTSSGKWICSQVIGNVTEDTQVDLKDDFYTAVNKERILKNKDDPEMASPFVERNEEIKQQIVSMIADESLNAPEIEAVREFYNDFMDMESRNAAGMEPIMPLVEEIKAIKDTDGITEFITGNGKFFSQIIDLVIGVDQENLTNNAVYIYHPLFIFSDADEYRSITDVGQRKKEAIQIMFQKLLTRVGYSQEEAEAMWEKLFAIETEMASVCVGLVDSYTIEYQQASYNPKSLAELEELAPDFPVAEILKPYTDAGIDRFILTEPESLVKINELYTQENVEAYKAYLLFSLFDSTVRFLDQECFDIFMEYLNAIYGSQIETAIEEYAYLLSNSMFGMEIGKLYEERYITEGTRQNVSEIVDDVVSVYRRRLETNDWLSKETTAKAVEKLDSLGKQIAGPGDWSMYEFSDYNFPENGGLMDDYYIFLEVNNEIMPIVATKEVERDVWDVRPQEINGFYSMINNDITLPAGILGGAFYDENASMEEKLGTIGQLIAHEITHAFDVGGSHYDKDGNIVDWWTDEDYAAFEERTDKVSAYYESIEALPGKYVIGDFIVSEAVADLGTISCMLEIARDIEGFDYKKFFESYAVILCDQISSEAAESSLQIDEHPFSNMRVNINVQQFEEFYETYGIEEGDGMYLAPEKRLSVW